MDQEIRLEVEELEERIAPAITITPPVPVAIPDVASGHTGVVSFG